MIDFELLDRLKNGSNQAPPPDMPAWKYALIVCGLQFGPAFATIFVLFLLSKLLD